MPAAEPAAPPEREPVGILLSGIAKRFESRGEDLTVIDGIDLAVAGGETLALVGPSGCGKSTLLRIAAGLEEPDEGTVELGGRTPLSHGRRGGLAVAFQEDALLPWRTLRGNVALARKLARQRPAPDHVDDLIAHVGLEGFETRRPAELSGGMRQRAAIARCLATSPSVLLLDEPFGAVDELTRRRLNLELPPVWGAGRTTVLLVTHSVTEAVLLADRVVVLSPRPARIVADVPVGLARPRTEEMLEMETFRQAVRAVERALRLPAAHHPSGCAAE